MNNRNTNIEAFFALLRAGLWEKEVRLIQYDQINYDEVYRLAEEQAVEGLITAGIELRPLEMKSDMMQNTDAPKMI